MDQRVEQRAKSLCEGNVFGWPPGNPLMIKWDMVGPDTRCGYRAIARAELEREGKLVSMIHQLRGGLRYYGSSSNVSDADAVLAAYEAEFAPKPRTLAEAVEAMLVSAPSIVFGSAPLTNVPLDVDGTPLALVRPAALAAVREALKREVGA